MYFIQRKDGHYLETVDQFLDRLEAGKMLSEYRTSDHSATFYISTRCCKNWKD